MTYSIYSKERNSLQFPVMCNGYVQIKTADAYSTEPTGIWDYQGGFTLEMIVTPYEVNGNPITDNENSQKSLPRDSDGLAYLSSANRHNVEMCLFYNTNLTLSLVNKTTTAFFQPAEYALKTSITIGGTTSTLESPVVFQSEVVDDSYSDPTAYVYQEFLPTYKKLTEVASITNATTFVLDSVANFAVGMPVYYLDNNNVIQSSGTVGSFDGVTKSVTLSGGSTNNFSVNDGVYVPVNRDVLYPETSHHVALSFGNGNIYLFYNGQMVAAGKHASQDEFQLDASDIFIGKAGSGGATTTQFMGEIHELGFYKEVRRNFREIGNIIPPFRTTLLFMDFEEATL